MADHQGRGRAKARGRAKPPTQGPAPTPGAAAPPVKPPPGLSKPAQSSGRATHRGVGHPTDVHVAGLAQRVGDLSLQGGGSGGNGNGSGNGTPVGRGNSRGGRQIFISNVKTKPETLTTKQGTTGQKVMIQANYFSLASHTHEWCLYQYRVDFAPYIELIGERKKLLRIQRNNIGAEYLFDGTVMYCSLFIDAPLELFSARESDGSQIRISIRRVGELVVGDSHYLQFFNILTKKCLRMLDLQMMRRDYFDPRARIQLQEYSLELWPGYRTTIRQHEGDVLMCAEIVHKEMRTDTCLNLLQDIVSRNPNDYKADFARSVVGRIVLTEFNNRTYTITDVDWTQKPRSTFNRNGTQVSFADYYHERYNVTIRDMNQPLLVSKNRDRDRRAVEAQAREQASSDSRIVLLVPELCKLTGLSDEMRTNFTLMRAVAQHTRIGPEDRVDRLMRMNQRLNGEQRVRQEFEAWKLKLSNNLVDIPARVLPQEQIVLGSNVIVPAGDECDWTRHLRSNPMFVMPQGGLSRWVLIYPNRVGRDVEPFVNTLCQAARGMRFNIAQPEYFELQNDRTQAYVEALDQVISTLSPQLIFVVLLNNKADRYSAVKKKSLVDRAVPTQVLLAKNLNKKGVMSIATKVAIQINCKIGGAPWSVQMPLGGLMVVGFDVCHDAQNRNKSYGAMVASLNKPMSRYFSAVSHHLTGEELSNDLAVNIVRALQTYQRHNNVLPSHILIYRDGVGDGQIPYVFSHEVERIKKAVRELYGQDPKLGFIIVCKRINTRLFHNKANPKPGTIVDDIITLPERYDFFVVSQFVNQGTVSPTSYNVIHDTLGLDPDKIQRLTYKMSHCYYNWSGTVRVPAPVQYAHKLAFLVSQSLHRPPNQSLEELLYFL